MTHSNNEKISASDIENKLKELKDEVYSISGGLSLAQKLGPSVTTVVSMLIRSSFKRKRKKPKDPMIQIQLFPKIKKYLPDSEDNINP